ncbi:retention module-containing protein, partial [Veronia pacifica]
MNLIVIEKSGVVSSISGDTRILYNGLPQTLADGFEMSAGSRVLLNEGTNFELAAVDGSTQLYTVNEEEAQDGEISVVDDIVALQEAIEAGLDPTSVQEAPAAGEPTSSGNNGFISLARTGSETIAKSGFDTSSFSDVSNDVSGFLGSNDLDANTQLRVTNTPSSNPATVVTLTGPTNIKEGQTSATFTVQLSDPMPEDGIVKFKYDFLNGADSSDIQQINSIPVQAGETVVTFTITVNPDSDIELSEGFTISVDTMETNDGDQAFSSLNLNAATQTISIEDATTTATLDGPTSVKEGETSATFTFTLSEPMPEDGVVNFKYDYINGADLNDITQVNSVPIKAGETEVTFSITANSDTLVEISEGFTVSVESVLTDNGNPAFPFANLDGATQTVDIEDTSDNLPDAVKVTLDGPTSVIEGEETTEYTITLDYPAPEGTTAILVYSYNDADNNDIEEVVEVKFDTNSTTATFKIKTKDDAFAEPGAVLKGESFIVLVDNIVYPNGNKVFEALNLDDANQQTNIIDETPPDVVTVSISGPTEVVEGETTGKYTLTLTEEAQTDVVVTLSYSGSAADGDDYTAKKTITIPKGSKTVDFTLDTKNDSESDPDETIIITISDAQGGGFESLVTDSTPVETVIKELSTDKVLVSIEGPGEVTEGDPTSNYTVKLTDKAVSPVTVTLTYTGTAESGEDYTAVTQVIIPAGADSETFFIQTKDDAFGEGTESIIITITDVQGGGFEAIGIDDDNDFVATNITDDHDSKETVLISIDGPADVVEGQTTAEYTVSLTEVAQKDVTVQLVYTGTATDGKDYTGFYNVTIKAGEKTATFTLETEDDAFADDGESIIVTIGNYGGGGFEKLAVDEANKSVTTTISDEAQGDTVTVAINGPDIVIEGQQTDEYTVFLDEPAQSPVTVTLAYTGSADDGEDYNKITTVVIPAGETSYSFKLNTIDDGLADGGEDIIITIADVSGGNFETPIAISTTENQVTTTITDDNDDKVLVSIEGPGSVVEGELTSKYTLKLTEKAQSEVTVTLTYSGSATSGEDYTAKTEIKIPAGSDMAQFDLQTIDDVYGEGTESIIVTITGVDGGGFEAIGIDEENDFVATNITDDYDNPEKVEISIDGPTEVTEGLDTAEYTVSLSSPAAKDVTVQLVYEGTATDGKDYKGVYDVTIKAGDTDAKFTIETINDPFADDGETFTVSIGNYGGGGFEGLGVSQTENSVTTTINDEAGGGTATVSITGPDSVTEGGETGEYTVSLDWPAQSDVTVKLVYSGTAKDGEDYTSEKTIVIPEGELSASFTVETIDDVYDDDGETIVVTIDEVSGGGFENDIAISATDNEVTTTINDDGDETAFVSIDGPGSISEGNIATPYILTLDKVSTQDVVVTLAYSGTADDGDDFRGVTEVTIPAGQLTEDFGVQILNDVFAEGSESMIITIVDVTGGNFENLKADPANKEVVTNIIDKEGGDKVLVSIDGPDTVVEGQTTDKYTVSLPVAGKTDVTVEIEYTGTATDGSDYKGVYLLTIPAGQSQVQFDIETLDDGLADNGETIIVTLGNVGGGTFEDLGVDPAAASVTTTIIDDASTAVILSIDGPDTITESESGKYTFSLTEETQSPVTVNLTYSGTAEDGTDYISVQQVTIPAGVTEYSFNIETKDDGLAEPNESFTVTIDSTTGGGFEALQISTTDGSVDTQIVDDNDDTVLASISGPTEVIEGAETTTYTVKLSEIAQSDVTVKLEYGGNAVAGVNFGPGVDFIAKPQIVIKKGSDTATFTLLTNDDFYGEGTESINIKLGDITGGGFEAVGVDPAKASVTTNITESGTPQEIQVSLSGPTEVTEGDTATGYKVELSDGAIALTDVVIQLEYTGTATDGTDYTKTTEVTIKAGDNSATFDIDTIDDVFDDDGETIIVSLGNIAGGGFEAIGPDDTNKEITTVINDDGNDVVTLSIDGPSSIIESQSGTYTLKFNAETQSEVTVNLTYSGTAEDGTDYTKVEQVTVPAGVTEYDFTIQTIDDGLSEPNESFTVTIDSIDGTGGFEGLQISDTEDSINTQIVDDNDDTVLVSIEGPTEVIEGAETTTYTVKLSEVAQSETTIKLNYEGNADFGVDFNGPTEVKVDAGSDTVTFTIQTLTDVYGEGTESINVILGDITGGDFEAIGVDPAKDRVTTNITESDIPQEVKVSITGPSEVMEGETTDKYTVTLTHDGQPVTAATDVVIQLEYTGTADDGTDYTKVTEITIAKGSSSYQFDIQTIEDTIFEGDETFTITLGNIAGGGFEAIGADGTANSVETTIKDDDPIPTLTVDDAGTVNEGQDATFDVTLGNP